MTSLSSHLHESARRYARKALQEHVAGDDSAFILFGATAIEHAAKALMAELNPAFLAPDNSFFHHAIGLTKASDHLYLLPNDLRTVGGSEVVNRVRQLWPDMEVSIELIRRLLSIRNGEAHLGIEHGAERQSMFATFVLALNAFLKIGTDDKVWDDYRDVVENAVDKHAEELKTYVLELLAKAKQRFIQRWANRAAGDPFFDFMTNHRESWLNDVTNQPVDCPACGQPAVAFGMTYPTEPEVEADDDNIPHLVGQHFAFHARLMRCEWCDLVLDGELFKAAGLPGSWPNDDVDVEELERILRIEYGDEDEGLGDGSWSFQSWREMRQ